MPQLEDWEVRMYHARAYVDSIYEMHGLEPPDHPDGGCAILPGRLKAYFSGPKFWPIFQSRKS